MLSYCKKYLSYVPLLIMNGGWVIMLWVTFSALTHEPILSGESAILSNVVIDFVQQGAWHYPVHAQSLFYPGVSKFMIHPPLHYLLSSGWVALLGIGVWQLHLQSVVSMLLGLAIVTVVTKRVYGTTSAMLVPVLAVASSAFIFSSLELRPDFTFGLLYGVTVMLFGRIYFQVTPPRRQNLHSFLLGFFAVAALSAHWFGYFVQLYLPCFALLMLLRYGRHGFVPIVWAALGWLFAMGLWWLAFGDDLLRSLIFVLIKGNDFRSSINAPVPNALAFLTQWSGGLWLITGLVFSALHAGTLLIRMACRKNLTIDGRITLFAWANLVAYSAFFYFFVGNKSPQYASNILCILYFLAAAGYAKATNSTLLLIKCERFTSTSLTVLAMLALSFSSVTARYLPSTPYAFVSATSYFEDTRRAMAMLIPHDAIIIVGGNAYPYLYDRPYESTMKLVAEHTLKNPGPLSLKEAIAYYQGMTSSQYANAPFPIADRIAAIKGAEYVAVADSGHSWQFLFYENAVWKKDFTEIANVMILAPAKQRYDFFPGHSSNYPKRFRILMHKGLKPPVFVSGPARLLAVGEHALIITPGTADRHAILSGDAWKALDDAGKLSKLNAYLDAMGWYGANLTQNEKDTIIQSLMPHVSNYMAWFHGQAFNSVPMTRTLADAIDYGFDMIGYPASFSSTPQGERHE